MAREKKRKKNEQEEEEEGGEVNVEAQERKRLLGLAYNNNILSQSSAQGFTPLNPSKTVIKHQGKDILKKSQRKNRYLFSFPGLIAPLSGGKIGELTDLGSKNPVLYLDFPQGRLKLFGTIVYPKNRYLTLQFSRGGKNVMCEDCFDTMIVFSDSFWVGKKEENPDEVRLELPEELYEGTQCEVDFQAGAGAKATKNSNIKKTLVRPVEKEMEGESPERQNNVIDITNGTPVRHSARTSGKKFNFAESSPGDGSDESVCDLSDEDSEEPAKSYKLPVDEDPESTDAAQIDTSEGILQSTKLSTEQAFQPDMSKLTTKQSSRGSLVQATISTLFKNAEEKSTSGSAKKANMPKVSNDMKQLNSSNSKNKNLKIQTTAQATQLRKEESTSSGRKAGANNEKKQNNDSIEDAEDIEEFSSASEDPDESDEDWCA